MKNALILLAPGCEEMEAVILIDTLRRGGVEVCAAGLTSDVLTASRGVRLLPDCSLDELEAPKGFDSLVLPGGLPGTEALREDLRVRDLLRAYAASETQWITAICAAPTVLAAHGLLEGKRYTCYPGLKDRIEQGTWVDEAVVEDGRIITSQGPGTSFACALHLLTRLADMETARSVAAGMLVPFSA